MGKNKTTGLIAILAILVVSGYFLFVKNYCEVVLPPKLGQHDPSLTIKDDGLYVCQTYFHKLLNKQIISEPVSQIEPLPEKSDVVDWKTYRNEKYGFEVRYPLDWVLREVNRPKSSISFTEPHDLNDEFKPEPMQGVNIEIYNSSAELLNNEVAELSFQGWIDKEATSSGFIRRKPITVGGAIGYEGLLLGITTYYAIFFEHNDKVYKIGTGDNIPTLYEQRVISSIKFIE